MYVSRAGLKPIGPIVSNWALRLRDLVLVLSTLGCSSTHNNTLQVVIENHWAPHLLRPALYVILCHGVFILYLNILLLAQIIHNGMWAIAIILRPLSINISHLNFLFCLYPRLDHYTYVCLNENEVVLFSLNLKTSYDSVTFDGIKLWRVTLSRNKQKPDMLLICELEKKNSSLNHSSYSCMIIQFLW